MILEEKTKEEIKQHATEDFPKECCGYILNVKGKEVVFRCRNTYDDPGNFFRIDEQDTNSAEGKGDILAVYHSHPNSFASPSSIDRSVSEALELPFVIYSLPNEQWHVYEPVGYQTPLLGRKFLHGVQDCFSLVRDYYKQRLQISFPDFFRQDEWWKRGQNLYLDNFESAGFRRVDSLEKNDVILMTIFSDVPNHSGVYLGNHVMLHHYYNRLSCREPYGGIWLKNTRLIVRHKNFFNS